MSKIKIEALISAPPQKVWDHYIQPEHITQWNFASDDWCCPHAEYDLRAGGKYLARMEAKDGSFGFDFEAVYEEVIRHEKIVYKLEDGREVITDFEDVADNTRVVTVFDAENQNPEDMQREGWQAILDNFKRYVEGR